MIESDSRRNEFYLISMNLRKFWIIRVKNGKKEYFGGGRFSRNNIR